MNYTCYWLRYPDLRHLAFLGLVRHYNEYGRFERRDLSCGSMSDARKLSNIEIMLRAGDVQSARDLIQRIDVDDDTVRMACYMMRYTDLRHLTLSGLREHFERHGRNEDRSHSCEGFSIDAIDTFRRHLANGERGVVVHPTFVKGIHQVVFGALVSNGKCYRNINSVDVYFHMSFHMHYTDATIGLFNRMVSLFPNASHYVKIDCDTYIKDQYALAMFLQARSPLYWGSCENTMNMLRVDGAPFSYAQGGIYSLSRSVVRPVVAQAAVIANSQNRMAIVGHLSNEDAMIGAACRRLNISLTCAGWVVSSFGYSSTSMAYHPHLPKCKMKEYGGSGPKHIDMVITACRGSCAHLVRNLQWFSSRNIVVHVHLYQKCGPNPPCLELGRLPLGSFRSVALENVGRCDHTMAHFMYKYYDSMADMVFFVKDTLSSWNFPKTSQSSMLSIASLYGYSCATPLYRESIGTMKSYLPKSYISPSVHASESDNGTAFLHISWEDFLRAHHVPKRRHLTVCYGGSYMVRRGLVRRHPKSLYGRVMASLSRGNNIVESHYMERLWAELFTDAYRMNCAKRSKMCITTYKKSMFCYGPEFLDVRGCL